MSKLSLTGNASGTGTFTIAAPNSNTDRVLTLPDEAGTVLSSGTPLSSFPSGFANGITMADQWRITSNFIVSSAATITGSWERNDDDGYNSIGSGMTESSGVFTFPETGIYLIHFTAEYFRDGDSRFANMTLRTTQDNSTYGYAARFNAFIQQTSGTSTFNGGSQQFIFDVTNTSTHKCFFEADAENTCTLTGTTERQITGATFIRLGDT